METTMATRKALLACLSIVAIVGTTWTQIPNAGFESWTLNEPDSWATSNAAPAYTNVTKSTTAHSGTAAIRGDAVALYTVVMAPTIQSGPGGHGFAYAQRPTAITGWYQFNSVGGDRFGVNVGLLKGGEGGTQVGIAASADPTTRSSYTQFSVPFVYYTTDIPDLCIAQFSVALPLAGASTHLGSYFLLDDLAFAGTSEVEIAREMPRAFTLGQNYPNPFNPTTQIIYSLPSAGRVQLTVHNLLGQTVATLVDNAKDAGTHNVTFSASGFSSGIYYYRLTTPHGTLTRSMTLVR
jgi:hypothetical protein